MQFSEIVNKNYIPAEKHGEYYQTREKYNQLVEKLLKNGSIVEIDRIKSEIVLDLTDLIYASNLSPDTKKSKVASLFSLFNQLKKTEIKEVRVETYQAPSYSSPNRTTYYESSSEDRRQMWGGNGRGNRE